MVRVWPLKKNPFFESVGKVVVFWQVRCNIWQKIHLFSAKNFVEIFFCQNSFPAIWRLKIVPFSTKLEGGGGGGSPYLNKITITITILSMILGYTYLVWKQCSRGSELCINVCNLQCIVINLTVVVIFMFKSCPYKLLILFIQRFN